MNESGWLGPALGWALAGLLASLPLRSTLGGAPYRYDDEGHLPVRRTGWLIPTVPLAAFGLATRWWPALPTAPAVVVTAAYCATLPLLAALAAIDLDVHRLPDRLTRTLAVGCAVASLLSSAATGQWSALGRALLAGAVLGTAYLLVMWGSPGRAGIGYGDVKLAPSLGILTGWVSWSAVATGTLLAFLAGGLWAAYLMLTGRARGTDRFAFGPCMILGALAAILLDGR